MEPLNSEVFFGILIILVLILIVAIPLRSFIIGFLEGYRGNKPKETADNNSDRASTQARDRRTPSQEIHDLDATKPTTIFLSYRRFDSADVSGRIYDRLSIKYGKEHVFKDVDSIPLGVDFRTYIDEMVSRTNIFLIVIGPDWFGSNVQDRKIDDPRDFVRLEVQSALDRNIPVIPLLVRNATMPSEGELPNEIQRLAFRNGIPVRADPDFDNDITRLLSGLSKLSNQKIKRTHDS